MTHPRVLFFTASAPDYLADSLLHGFRSLLGSNVVDYPKCDVLYKKSGIDLNGSVHGKGFTCYGLLDDIPIDRYDIFRKIKEGYFDLVIFSSIHRQFGFFVQLLPWLDSKKTIIIDGEDHPAIFPYHGNYWRLSEFRNLPSPHTFFPYYKREWTPDTIRYRWFLTLPSWIASVIKPPNSLRPIAFSIPKEKIVTAIPRKIKLFPDHIVDQEVSENIPNSAISHVFSDESSYYKDLSLSKYGITTKRAGWDCIRHYELAANACVPCFRDLKKKPLTCAPFGLDFTNSISYESYSDLMQKIALISDQQYEDLQSNILKWAASQSTEIRAQNLLSDFGM